MAGRDVRLDCQVQAGNRQHEPDVAVVGIWRVVDGQIVEHWDVVQPVPDGSDMF